MNPLQNDEGIDPSEGSEDDQSPMARQRLPLFPLSAPLFPGMALPLHIFELRYRQLLRDQASSDPIFGVVLTRSGREVGDEPEIFDIGTAASLLGMREHDDGRADIAVRGGRRFRVIDTDWTGPYLVANVEWIVDPEDDASDEQLVTLADRTRTAMMRLVAAAAGAGNMPVPELSLPQNPTDLGYLLSRTLWLNTWERQELLESPTSQERLERLRLIIRREHRLLTQAGAAGAPIEHPGSRFLPN